MWLVTLVKALFWSVRAKESYLLVGWATKGEVRMYVQHHVWTAL